MNNIETKESLIKSQIIPISLTFVVCAFLIFVLRLEIGALNKFTANDILLRINWIDVLIGLAIYLKTSVDFAIYIGNLMSGNNGWKSRVAIEIGTAFGNAAGTMAILLIWTFFKEVRWLLALMILLAALVLFKLAEDGLEHAELGDARYPLWFKRVVYVFERLLDYLNRVIAPILKYIIPGLRLRGGRALCFWPLFALSFTVPFVLGLDDFAGYVPLFNVVNVFGFAIGVFGGHMLLNMLLYVSPRRTTAIVKNPVISFFGSVAFVGLGLWGLAEVAHLIGV